MRKLLIVCMLGCTTLLQAQPNAQDLLLQFISSQDYTYFLNRSQFGTNGSLDLASCKVKFQQTPELDGRVIPILELPFIIQEAGNAKVVGQLQAVRVKEDYNRLPNNGKYLLLYRDYRGFDYTSKSGTVKIHDLNYDEYLVGTGSIQNGTLLDYETFPLPPVVAEKYGIDPSKSHLCDANNSGNITFGECFRCMVRECQSSFRCSLLCLIGNIGVLKGQCDAAMVLACTYISMRY